ncbi:hypothetical protein Q765_00345 [Flavobacterium rivuli WB 3.3-2 = DSM 21788]|uniref:Uncharacterized protein n=1 Tax=Flavobacterium rivuli WB 3.3-2 = DSM 21788 TaxID=1121895 RepID=A0A0A2M9S7_9FLAO|nr:hypothetical protein [Flavobacterium rivuli]KGO88401.1 hypothetical protein Q765_00345 [Flavobacterium rivuli WB 3.3-2 = DSM 21788]
MPKQKYAKNGEAAAAYECSKRTCKWQGTTDQKAEKYNGYGITEHVCPKCGNNSFYGLLNPVT